MENKTSSPTIENQENSDKIYPVNYLTTENVSRYRKIMGYFYKKHRQMQGALYRPEVLEMMQHEFSKDYDEGKLDADLESLVLWKNLQKQQEIIRPKSIEEYRNRNFRFQISEEGIIVEEMVGRLVHAKHQAQGALDEKGFRNLLELIRCLLREEARNADTWLEIRKQFQQIIQDTSDYIGYITSPEVDSRMKTEQFLVYKDKFVSYLRDFISSVQELYYSFNVEIKRMDLLDFTKLVEEIHKKEQERPTFEEIAFEDIKEQVLAEKKALRKWFFSDTAQPSEYDSLMKQTDQMISKITSLIYYFTQEMHQYQSRKKDYLHIAKWFEQAQSLDEAKKIHAAVFGLEHTRHFFVPSLSSAANNREDSWALEPSILTLDTRGIGARREYKAQSVVIDKEKQERQIRNYLIEEQESKEKIESYFIENQIDFKDISLLDSYSQRVFLKWISQAIASIDPTIQKKKETIKQTISTQMDYSVKVSIDPSQRIEVNCQEGILEMPHVFMERIIHES